MNMNEYLKEDSTHGAWHGKFNGMAFRMQNNTGTTIIIPRLLKGFIIILLFLVGFFSCVGYKVHSKIT